MRRFSIILVLALAALFLKNSSSFCQYVNNNDIDVSIMYFKGKVSEISLVNSKITVQKDKENTKRTFTITERTKFFKRSYDSYTDSTANVVVSSTDIMQDDQVVVEYYYDPQAPDVLEAKSVELIK